jgi:hypothetical protein
MDATSTNLTGVIVECGIDNDDLRDFVGKSLPQWLSEHSKTTMVVRENGDHELVPIEVHLTHLELVNDGWNHRFNFRGTTHVDGVERGVHGHLMMRGITASSNRGVIQG